MARQKKQTYAEKYFPKGMHFNYEGRDAVVLSHSASDPYIVGIGWIDDDGEPYTMTIMADRTYLIDGLH